MQKNILILINKYNIQCNEIISIIDKKPINEIRALQKTIINDLNKLAKEIEQYENCMFRLP